MGPANFALISCVLSIVPVFVSLYRTLCLDSVTSHLMSDVECLFSGGLLYCFVSYTLVGATRNSVVLVCPVLSVELVISVRPDAIFISSLLVVLRLLIPSLTFWKSLIPKIPSTLSSRLIVIELSGST